MIGLPLAGSSPHLKNMATSVVQLNNAAPFTGLNKVYFLSAGAGVIYGVNRQTESQIQTNNAGNVGVNSSGQAKYVRLFGDASRTTWTSTDFPALNNAHDDGAALTNANRLCTVLVVDGVAQTRVQSDATPGASEYKIALSGGVYTLTSKSAANGAHAAGVKLEVYMCTTADIVTQGALTAGVMIEGTCYDFMVAHTAAVAMTADRV
jgi:hypothetical protein